MIVKYAHVEVMEVPDNTPENMINAIVRENVGCDADYSYTTDGTSPLNYDIELSTSKCESY